MLGVRRQLAVVPARTLSTSIVPAKQTEVEPGYALKREVGRAKCNITFEIKFLINYLVYDNKVEYLTTKLDDVANYIRSSSLWPMTFGYVSILDQARNYFFSGFFLFTPDLHELLPT